MKLLIAGGGTGGHVFPALAVAREWLRRGESREVVFVGTERGMEKKLVPQAGLPLETIRSAGLKGMGPLRLARNLAQLGPGLWDSDRILRRHHFSAAFGAGGYAAGPMLLMADLRGLPSVIFEPNAEPGFTNRILASMATRIAVGYPSAAERLGRRAVVTGCPVRREFFYAEERQPAQPYRLLITGGSQGAHVINAAMISALDFLSAQRAQLSIVHQTGERDCNEVRDVYARHEFQAEVAPFLADMPERFAAADLIVCRSGAVTVAEVAAAGRAALFIPFGAATDSHQLRNAQEMVTAGAALLVLQEELTGVRLAREIAAVIADPQSLVALAENARDMARPNAARDIVNLIEEVCRT